MIIRIADQDLDISIFAGRVEDERRVKKLYLDKRVWRNSRDNWVSFESDPKLRVTKKNIYGRCVPCISSLFHQLQEGREETSWVTGENGRR